MTEDTNQTEQKELETFTDELSDEALDREGGRFVCMSGGGASGGSCR